MSTDDKRAKRIETALDTMAEIAENGNSDDSRYDRLRAAEEILRHYREADLLDSIRTRGITVNINGAVPVRPMTRAEMEV